MTMGRTAFFERAYSTFPDALAIEELLLEYTTSEPRRRIALLKRLQRQYWGVPSEVASLAVEDPHTNVRVWYARNGSGDELEKLQSDPESLVRASLAANDHASLGFPGETWWRQATELERLASLRRWHIDEGFVLKLFDPEDEQLGLTQPERLRYAITFLAARAGKIEKWHRSYDDASSDSPHHLADLGSSFGGELMELMPKWPENAGIQDFVYRFCEPVGNVDVVYRFIETSRCRRLLLENVVAHHWNFATRDEVERMLDLARHDADDRCRELAHMDPALPFSYWRPGQWRRVLREAKRKLDYAALRGLARNPQLNGRQLKELKGFAREPGEKAEPREALNWDDVHDAMRPLAMVLRQHGTLPSLTFHQDDDNKAEDESTRREKIEEYKSALKVAKQAESQENERGQPGWAKRLGWFLQDKLDSLRNT